MFEIYSVFEKRCEITLFISFHQIFEQKFTELIDFLSFCQSHLSILKRFENITPHYLYIDDAKIMNNFCILCKRKRFFYYLCNRYDS